MQEIRSLNPPVVTGICDPNESRALLRRSLKLGSKLKHLIIKMTAAFVVIKFFYYNKFHLNIRKT